MRFLEISEVEVWCDEHRIALEESEVGVAPDPRLPHAVRTLYANGKRSGREPAVAAAAVHALGDWDECLLWITLVGVWPSSEDWPAYYALRAAEGERRSLDIAPGHLFESGERAKLERFATSAMENGWNAFVLPARAGQPTNVRFCISHDEWVELQGREPVEFPPMAV